MGKEEKSLLHTPTIEEIIDGFPTLEEKFRIYPDEARDHLPLTSQKNQKRRHWDEDIPYAKQFEINKLEKALCQLISEQGPIPLLIEHLENNPETIRFRDELVQYVMTHPSLLRGLVKVNPVHGTRRSNDDDDDFSFRGEREFNRPPYVKMTKDYEHNIDLFLKATAELSDMPIFLQSVRNAFVLEKEVLTQVREIIKHSYEGSIDVAGTITRPEIGKYQNWRKDKDIDSSQSKYHLEINFAPINTIQTRENESGISKSYRFTERRRTNKISTRSVQTDNYIVNVLDLKKNIEKSIKTILSTKKKKLTFGESLDFNTRIYAEQTGIGTYKSTISYTIQGSDFTYSDRRTTYGGAGFGLVGLLSAAEEASIGKVLQKIEPRIGFYNPLFSDLHNLARHTQLAQELIKLGATYFPISDDPTMHIELEGMRNPLLVLKKKKDIARNYVILTDKKNCAMLTGANKNGKSSYEIALTLTCILRQASLPPFCNSGTLYPRSCIIGDFPEYRGDMTSGESAFSGDCSAKAQLLEKIIPYALVILDDIGHGTDPDDSKAVLGRIFDATSQLKSVSLVCSTHYKDLVADLTTKLPGIYPIAFELDINKKCTYTGTHGKIATTSEGTLVADQSGLSQANLDRLVNTWKAKGLTRD